MGVILLKVPLGLRVSFVLSSPSFTGWGLPPAPFPVWRFWVQQPETTFLSIAPKAGEHRCLCACE